MNLGTLIAAFVPFAATRTFGSHSEKAFRVPLYVALALPTISVAAELCVLVESPWWLYLHGRRDEARAVLLRLRPDGEAAFEEMKRTIADAQHQTTGIYLDLFRRENRRRTFCAVFPSMSQNLTGQNFAGGYSTYFLMLAGSAQPLLNSTIITAVGLVANIGSFFVIERRNVGRWGLLFGGVVIMATCMCK